MRRRAAGLAAATLALLWPALAQACAVCGLGGRNRSAFFVTTIVLSLLPLGMIAAGLVWIARNARTLLAGEFVDRDEPAGHDAGLPGLNESP